MLRFVKLLFLSFSLIVIGLYGYGLLYASLETYDYVFNALSLLGWGVFSYFGYQLLNDLN